MNSEKTSNIILRVLDFFYILRPTLFFPGITIYLFGVNDSEINFSIIHFSIILLLLSITYLTNQIFDIKTDTINDKLFFLTRKIISLKFAKLYNILLYISFITLYSYIFNTINIPFLTVVFVLYFVIVVLYNFEFFKWKAKPFLSIFSSFLGGIFFYLAGYYSTLDNLNIVNIKFVTESILSSLPYGIAVLSVSIMTMISDMKGDEISGKKTYAVYFNIRSSNYSIILLSIINIFLSHLIRNDTIFYISIISILFSLLYQFKNYDEKYLFYNVKVSILILSLTIAYHYPLYLLIIAIYFFVTRIYYKKRFNIIYP